MSVKISELQDRVADLEIQNSGLESNSNRKTNDLESKLNVSLADNRVLREELRQSQTTSATRKGALDEALPKIGSLEKTLREFQTTSLWNEEYKTMEQDLSVQVAQVNDLSRRNRRLEQEMSSLRRQLQSEAILQEKLTSLNTQLRLLQGVRDKLASTEVEVALLRKERSMWESWLEKSDVERPEDLTKLIAELRFDKAQLAEQLSLAQSEFAQTNSIIAEQGDLDGAKQQKIVELEEAIKKQRTVANRVNRQKNLFQKEIVLLKEQLRLFESEEVTMNLADQDEIRNKRVIELEKLLQEYKAEIDHLQSRLNTPVDLIPNSELGQKRLFEESANNERVQALQFEIGTHKRSESMLKKESDNLSLQLELLTAKLETYKSRVLQHRDSPLAKIETVKQTTLDNLRASNQDLLSQLQGQPVTESVPKSVFTMLQTELVAAQDNVKEKEKRMRRLKETWAAKSSEFREAVYSLLGYRLDFLQNGRVRVSSMYADNPSQAIVFDGETSNMQIVGNSSNEDATEWSQEINTIVQFWISERDSVPGLLSALTLELVEHQHKSD